MPCDDRSGDWSDTAASQGPPKMSSKPPEAQGGKETWFGRTTALLTPCVWTFSLQDAFLLLSALQGVVPFEGSPGELVHM